MNKLGNKVITIPNNLMKTTYQFLKIHITKGFKIKVLQELNLISLDL